MNFSSPAIQSIFELAFLWIFFEKFPAEWIWSKNIAKKAHPLHEFSWWFDIILYYTDNAASQNTVVIIIRAHARNIRAIILHQISKFDWCMMATAAQCDQKTNVLATNQFTIILISSPMDLIESDTLLSIIYFIWLLFTLVCLHKSFWSCVLF